MAVSSLVFDFYRVLLFPHQQGSVNDAAPTTHGTLNTDLLAFLTRLPQEMHLYIYSSSLMLQLPPLRAKLQPPFQDIFISKELHWPKDRSESYHKLASHLHQKPTDLLFIDDQPFNVDAAHQAGWNTLLFENNTHLFTQLKRDFNIEPSSH